MIINVVSFGALGLHITGCLASFQGHLAKRAYQYDGCTSAERTTLDKELGYAAQMASYAKDHFTEQPYLSSFFPASSNRDNVKDVFSQLEKLTDPANAEYAAITLKCLTATEKLCAQVDVITKKGVFQAAMRPDEQTMYFCPSFFGDIDDTDTKLNTCKSSGTSCGMTLKEFRKTKSFIVLHEFTHTGFTLQSWNKKKPTKVNGLDMKAKHHYTSEFLPAVDYAYNVEDCLALKSGTFVRSQRPYGKNKNKWDASNIWCPDASNTSQEGICDPSNANFNADSYVFVAAGVWWTSQCNWGTAIPIQSTIPKRSLTHPHIRGRNYCNSTYVSDGADVLDFDPPYGEIEDDTTTTTNAETPVCTNYADPHVGTSGLDYCICSNGATISIASSTSGQSSYQPCPWTSLPAAALTTSSPTVTTNTPQYQFTTTLLNSEVIECETSTKKGWAGLDPIAVCAGSTAILKTPPPTPAATIQVGKQKVNVGTLTGDTLFTSISSALDQLCPTPTDDSFVECATDSVKIKNIEYINDNSLETNGYLEVFVQNSNYNNSGLRTAMINSIARTAGSTANGTNCYDAEYEKEVMYDHYHEMERLNTTHCNVAQAANAEYFDGTNTGINDNINAYWNFHIEYDAGAEFICELFVGAVEAAVIEFAPEFAVGDVELGNEIVAACADLAG